MTVCGSRDNNYDQLGDGSTSNRNTFADVVPSDAIAVVANYYHSMVLKRCDNV